MILKTAANYNDEGGYIEAWKNSDGTTEVKLIPKSGGGDEGKQGLKSITISPAITTTPALDSVAPIYYDDLTEQEKQSKDITRVVKYDEETVPSDSYQITFKPTTDWYAAENMVFGEKGEAVTIETEKDGETFYANVLLSNGTTQETTTEYFALTITIEKNGGE